MSTIVVSSWTALSDVRKFLPIIERMYASSDRLVSTNSGLTRDVTEILMSSDHRETSIECLRSSVLMQRERWGCGGRTVALWSCLFYQAMSDLKECGVPLAITQILMEIAIQECEDEVRGMSQPVLGKNFKELCLGLCHGTPDWSLLVDVCIRGRDNTASSQDTLKSSDVSPHFLLNNVVLEIEQNYSPSEIIPGFLLKSSEILSGSKLVILIAGDVTEKACHVGYKGLVKEERVTTAEQYGNQKIISWAERVITFLHNLGVQVVLATGICGHPFESSLVRVVSGIPYETLDKLARALDVDMLPSVQHAISGDVISVKFEKHSDNFLCLTPNLPDNQHFTILLRTPLKCDTTTRYKSYVSRVYHALQGKTVVPGQGITERICAGLIQNFRISGDHIRRYDISSDMNDVQLWYSIVTQKLSDLLYRVSSLTAKNAYEDSFSSDSCLDDFEKDLSDLCLEDRHESETTDKYCAYDEPLSKMSSLNIAMETARVLASVSLTLTPTSSI